MNAKDRFIQYLISKGYHESTVFENEWFGNNPEIFYYTLFDDYFEVYTEYKDRFAMKFYYSDVF